MIRNFQRHCKEALVQRGQLNIPNIKKPVVLLAIGTLIYLLIAGMIAPGNKPGLYFETEGGLVTILTASFLALAGIFSGMAFLMSRERKGFFKYFWLLAMLGFVFLSLDELNGFNEVYGRMLRSEVGVPPEGFRRWNDIIVVLYGVVGVFVMSGFLPELFRYPKVMQLMGIAFLFYFIHTFIDTTIESSTDLSTIIEESAKVFSSEYLAIAMFVAMLGMKAAKNLKVG